MLCSELFLANLSAIPKLGTLVSSKRHQFLPKISKTTALVSFFFIQLFEEEEEEKSCIEGTQNLLTDADSIPIAMKRRKKLNGGF